MEFGLTEVVLFYAFGALLAHGGIMAFEGWLFWALLCTALAIAANSYHKGKKSRL